MGFTLLPVRPWAGRYSRIPGNNTVFHAVRRDGRPCVEVSWVEDGDLYSGISTSSDTQELADAVIEAKGPSASGGAFLIDEFSRVLVPSIRGGDAVCCGRWTGALRFDHPDGFEWDPFDDADLDTGDRWLGPYVGMRYNLSARSEIYLWHGACGEKETPGVQDVDLIRALRKVRRGGAARFLVTYNGVVLTKLQDEECDWNPDQPDRWVPVYVGRIDTDRWFTP